MCWCSCSWNHSGFQGWQVSLVFAAGSTYKLKQADRSESHCLSPLASKTSSEACDTGWQDAVIILNKLHLESTSSVNRLCTSGRWYGVCGHNRCKQLSPFVCTVVYEHTWPCKCSSACVCCSPAGQVLQIRFWNVSCICEQARTNKRTVYSVYAFLHIGHFVGVYIAVVHKSGATATTTVPIATLGQVDRVNQEFDGPSTLRSGSSFMAM